MPHGDTSLSIANPGLTVVERRGLDRIFQRPLSHNLSRRDVIDLFEAAGRAEHAHNGNLVLKLGTGRQAFKAEQDKDLSAPDAN